MTIRDDGGSAFPREIKETLKISYGVDGRNGAVFDINQHEGSSKDDGRGMSLRDYFAAKAMQIFEADSHTNVDWLAGKAYEIADAMLAERAK